MAWRWGLLLLELAAVLLGCAPVEAAVDEVWVDAAGGEPSPVLRLNSSNFDQVLKSTERLVVVFWGPKCRRCQYTAKQFREAAEELLLKNATTRLAQVDNQNEQASELASRYKLQMYPSILYFVNGTRGERFNSVRTASAMKNWVLRREGKFIKELEEGEVEKFLSSDGFTFALVARVKPNTVRAKAYAQAVQMMSRWDKEHTVLATVVWLPKSAHANSDASLLIHRKGFEEPDAERLYYTAAWTGGNLAKWVRISTLPTIARGKKVDLERYIETNAEEFLWEGIVVALVDDVRLTEEDTEEPLTPLMLTQMAALAEVERKWKFAVLELNETSIDNLRVLAVDDGAEPQLCVLKFTEPIKRFVLEGAEAMAQPDAVRSFFGKVRAGKVKRSYTSEPLPEEEFEDGVRVLVGKNFDKFVMNPRTDVFVKFYAPWCKHCLALEPVWAELAQTVEQQGWYDRGVVIANFNADDNECDELVDKYPKLVLYPAVDAKEKFRQKFVFEHDANVEALLDFLLDNAVNLEGLMGRSDL